MWVDIIHHHATRTPRRPALVLRKAGSPERNIYSYADLDREASGWAARLHARGIGKGDRVAFWATNRPEHLTLFFACTRLGAVFVPLNFRLGKAELEAQLRLLDPSLLLCGSPCPEIDWPLTVLEAMRGENGVDRPRAEPSMDDTLMMLFTSGSTGEPKGVMLHAGMLLWNCINTHLDWGLLADDVSVIHTPFFHTGGYNVTCLPLLRLGGCLVLTDRFDAEDMLRVLAEERVSVFFAVPTMFRMMRDAANFFTADLSALRFCISGGAPCPPDLIAVYRDRGIPLKQGFGLTEVGPNCFAMSDAEARDRPESVGRPMLHSRMKLVDDTGRSVGSGEVGELCIAGPHVCKGYWRAPDRFAEAFRGGFFHTGDLMRRDAEGFYQVVGRKKDMYISGGENVYPGEVERVLRLHPQIADAVVVPVPDPKWGEVGFAFLKGSRSLDLAGVRTFLDPHLSRYKHPRHLGFLETFPLLPNNKVDVSALRQRAAAEVGDG